MLVKQILAAKPNGNEVLTIAPEATLAEAAALLAARRIGSLVVSEDGTTPLGILSERDIVREVGRQGSACLARSVGEIMTRKVSTTRPDEDADSVLRKMTEGRFRHLPVMEEGRMIGLISIGDVVKARIDELAMEKQALEGMIMGH